MDRIICVVGPTASGKTKLAVQLAKLYGGEVVSCDSMQIYKHMDIGTAKPTKEEMEGVHHHLLDMVEPGEDFSAGKYVQLADSCVQDILSRGKTAVIAGGTGLYVDSLIAGRSFAPVPQTGRREALETQLRENGGEAMLARLRSIDPEAAARLHPADEKRIVRALEVYEETGKTITQHNLETQAIPPRYRPVWLGLDYSDRAVLYRRIDLRVDKMLEDGLLDEIRALLALGVSPKATAMQEKQMMSERASTSTCLPKAFLPLWVLSMQRIAATTASTRARRGRITQRAIVKADISKISFMFDYLSSPILTGLKGIPSPS